MKFFNEKLTEFFWTLTYFENASEYTFTCSKPLIVIGSLSVYKYINLSNQEIFSNPCNFRLIDANDLGDFFYNMEIRLATLDVSFKHIQKRLEILLFYQWVIFWKGDA